MRSTRWPGPCTASSCPRGFTLLELIISLSIVAALLVITFGGLRVGLAAWQRGEDRAQAQQHARSLTLVLTAALEGAYPYRGVEEGGAEATVLFQGEGSRVSFATVAPPFPGSEPIAFTAVTLSLETGEAPGLAIRQKALPNAEPFAPEQPLLVEASVTEATFRYLRDGETWEDRWDGKAEGRLPRAVEVTLGTRLGDRVTEHAPLVIPVRVTQP